MIRNGEIRDRDSTRGSRCRSKRAVLDAKIARDDIHQHARAGIERVTVLTLAERGDHRVANFTCLRVRNRPFQPLPRADENRAAVIAGVRHHQHHRAGVATLVADLGGGAHLPRPPNGERHVARGIVANRRQRDDREVGSGGILQVLQPGIEGVHLTCVQQVRHIGDEPGGLCRKELGHPILRRQGNRHRKLEHQQRTDTFLHSEYSLHSPA